MAAPAVAYTVKGSVECPDVLKEDSNEAYSLANRWWVLGYITGRNYQTELQTGDATQTGAGVDEDQIYAYVIEFCKNNPDKDMDDASIDLYESLK